MPTSGLDLKLERTAARVSVKELAARMDVSPARISTIESRAVVTERAAEKYRAALAALPAVAAATDAGAVA